MVEVSEETMQFMRKQAWAQIEANQLKQDELAVERAKVEAAQMDLRLKDKDLELKRQIENRRDGRFAEVLARYANLAEQLTGLIENGNISDIIMREGFEEFSAEVKLIKQGLYALLGRDGAEIQRVRAELKYEFDQEETQLLLIKQRRNLRKLKEQEANFGIQVPLYLLNDIEAVESQIVNLQQQLTA